MRKARWTSRYTTSSFFGLTEADKIYIYEEIFQAVYHGKVEYDSAWRMPVPIRKWWIQRVRKELEKASGQGSEHTDPFGRKGGRVE